MLIRQAPQVRGFGRRDAARLGIAVSLLVAALTAILSVDLLQDRPQMRLGEVAASDVRAPYSVSNFASEFGTVRAREQARLRVTPQYDFNEQKGVLAAALQRAALDARLAPVDAAFNAVLSEEARRAALAGAVPGLTTRAVVILQGLTTQEWLGLRAEMQRVLEQVERSEIKDTGTALAAVRDSLPSRLSASFSREERDLAAEILSPVVVPNSTYDEAATKRAEEAAAASVAPVTYSFQRDELLIPRGKRLTAEDVEKMAFFGLMEPSRPDLARVGGWFLLSLLVVGLLLGWVWRFRPEFWHRNNALFLVGFLLVAATLGVKITADRSILPFFVPTAAMGLLVAILLDSGAGMLVVACLGVLAGVATGSLELAVFVFLGGFAGIVTIRRGERLHHFIQAGIAVLLVDAVVVTLFTLLGDRDVYGWLQLLGASLAHAGGSAVAAVGSFALLGNVFGITTAFQLLELANPSQPLLRRLLMETSGTYHHSLMVGNLAERAAEAIGADPLLARVAAYYHDIGKLANPLAFIENQGGMRNIHDELTPEQSASVLKAHVANGIDLAYQYRLPTAIIAFIPQHHGTAFMSYFYAKAKDAAIRDAGATPGTPAAEAAAATVDPARFRHVGPKPQSREAALLMLADGVEASVRSLTSQDEPAIRGMVDRILKERMEDGQFDECDLTLRDLDRVREAFVAQLLGMYHRRVEYPQNKIVELESRRASTSGK